jgi:hypothetical protein
MFKPLQFLADCLTYSVFGPGRASLAGSAVNFFVFEPRSA